LAQGPISWRSRRQRITALSSCESEYIALAEGAREVTWLRQLCAEIGIQQDTTTIHCDNQSAIATADTVATNERSKHIDVRYHYIREQIQEKNMKVSYLSTVDMLADILTKTSTFDAICKFRNALMTRQTSG
jgi:agmatine/peptidylarginine deiminase